MRLALAPLATALALAAAPLAHAAPPLAKADQAYADWLDAGYAKSTIEAGTLTRIDGRGLTAWTRLKVVRGRRLKRLLGETAKMKLAGEDARALKRMQAALGAASTTPPASTEEASERLCATASDQALAETRLSDALYACFERWGNHVPFEGRSIARATALELLQQLDAPARRKALFYALAPLWSRIDAADEPTSPYRRLVRLAAADARAQGGSAIEQAARTLGETQDQVEAQLTAALEAWRTVNPGPPIEPWDYWRRYAEGLAPLDAAIPAAAIPELNRRYYEDLGLDLTRLGVISDLGVRPGKAPLAYADFVRIGRQTPQGWRPARVRVSANVERGGLFVLNEIVHENGHAAHMMAVRARPAFFDLGDDLFVEAFADVTSWSVAEPAWQRRYLNLAAPDGVGRRALLANVMLDVAWGLFELRMLKAPDSDPNQVWTEITSTYLNIVPHPEIAWWALRVQLVEQPGYMINYGLGAMVTADLRDRFRRAVGDFDAGNPRWYPYASAHLLRFGAAAPTQDLLRGFLGRPVSIEPLLAMIRSLPPER
ncbi:hypothetical protein [Phenylobacterium montanum]|uniref:Peptidase M3A/M3B catalytic domain-containing protein n=1 Tax=Phenylobacterium montanum TaxID=2823693 RepID=A0A975G5K4_9CAUL|nr:hypothetical protein [Caulobacter sp. S6]QUD90461.1 hypothetical protein KCG34_11655 [Caulobacter sp. S6]